MKGSLQDSKSGFRWTLGCKSRILSSRISMTSAPLQLAASIATVAVEKEFATMEVHSSARLCMSPSSGAQRTATGRSDCMLLFLSLPLTTEATKDARVWPESEQDTARGAVARFGPAGRMRDEPPNWLTACMLESNAGERQCSPGRDALQGMRTAS